MANSSNNSAGIILVHNHISGNTELSTDDIETTRKVAQAREIIVIPLLDHIIVSNWNYTSMRQVDVQRTLGLFPVIEKLK